MIQLAEPTAQPGGTNAADKSSMSDQMHGVDRDGAGLNATTSLPQVHCGHTCKALHALSWPSFFCRASGSEQPQFLQFSRTFQARLLRPICPFRAGTSGAAQPRAMASFSCEHAEFCAPPALCAALVAGAGGHPEAGRAGRCVRSRHRGPIRGVLSARIVDRPERA